MPEIIVIIGTAGMLLLLTAFVGNMLKKLASDSVAYNVLNILGGGILTYYAYALNSMPFLILEGVWAGFAAYNLFIVMKKQNKKNKK